jgi:hypothetical protein
MNGINVPTCFFLTLLSIKGQLKSQAGSEVNRNFEDRILLITDQRHGEQETLQHPLVEVKRQYFAATSSL